MENYLILENYSNFAVKWVRKGNEEHFRTLHKVTTPFFQVRYVFNERPQRRLLPSHHVPQFKNLSFSLYYFLVVISFSTRSIPLRAFLNRKEKLGLYSILLPSEIIIIYFFSKPVVLVKLAISLSIRNLMEQFL